MVIIKQSADNFANGNNIFKSFRNRIIWLIGHIYFRSLTLEGVENLPPQGLIIFVSNHRNGAADGLVVKTLFPRTFLIVGTNFTKFFYTRFLLKGNVDIHRAPRHDTERLFNQHQMAVAAHRASAGEAVVMFPEGTSKLGPSLLPLKKGIFYLCRDIVLAAQGQPVFLVPLGLHYERGWVFRSAALVRIGEAKLIKNTDMTDVDCFMKWFDGIMRQVTINYADKKEQVTAERFAAFSSSYCRHFSHEEICRLFAAGDVPSKLTDEYLRIMQETEPQTHCESLLIHENHLWRGLALLIILTPLVAVTFILNFLPAGTSWLAARSLADDDNVITLWRLLTAIPLVLLEWLAGLVFLFLFCSAGTAAMAAALYLVVTAAGIQVYHPWKCLLIKTVNQFTRPVQDIRNLIQKIRQWCRNRKTIK